MKKTTVLLYSLSIIIILQSFQLANATSKTNKLFPGGFHGTLITKVQKGDHIQGCFSISKIGPYKNTHTGEIQTYQINVKIVFFNSINQTIHTIQEYNKTSEGIFNYTAPNQGNISHWTYCSSRRFLLDARTPEITFNYEIEPTPSPTPIELEAIIGVIIIISVFGTGIGFFIYLLKKN